MAVVARDRLELARTDARVGSFIPILLETLARENGVLRDDHTRPCGTSESKAGDGGHCVVNVLGVEIDTTSFAMYTFSISVLAQAILVVSISCAADHGNYRKKLLLGFGWVGSFAVMGYIFISKSTYLIGALLAIISNTSFGASFVLLNSFLPLLVRHHPSVLDKHLMSAPDLSHTNPESQPMDDSLDNEVEGTLVLVDSQSSLLTAGQEDYAPVDKSTRDDITSHELHLSTQISAKGIGIGYSAGLVLQCVAIAIVIAAGKDHQTLGQRFALLLIGVWWATFTIPAAIWLRPRPGPPLLIKSKWKGSRAWLGYFVQAWASLFKTLKLARRLLDIMLFLGSWFLLSDAIATTSSTAILFAKGELNMKTWALALINVISTLCGVIGAFSWSYISKHFGLRPHQTILACIALFELIPIYGLLGYLPFIQSWGVFGLQQEWEMFPLAAIYGFVLGGLSGFCRSLYGELIPPGSEAAFYALYAITDKGSSVFGPTIVGIIIQRTGSIRPAFWFLACLIGLPAPLIWFVNVERGKREGEKLAATVGTFGMNTGAPDGEGDIDSMRTETYDETYDETRDGEETVRENTEISS